MNSRGRRIVVIGVAVALVAIGAGSAYAAMSSSGPAYRLGTVTSADVTATLNVVGTLNPAHQADVGFSVSGTVATVAVRQGQPVTAGQTLGTLDTGPLKASLTAAQSALANARLTVAGDIASQDAAASGSSGTSGSSGQSGSSGSLAALRPLQQAVVKGQRAVDTALAKAGTDLALVRQACSAPPAKGSGSAAPGPRPSPSPAPTISPSPATCASAEQHELTDETTVLHAQQALSAQLSALSAALARAIGASSGAGQGGASADPPAGHGASTAGGSSAGPVSADQLAADQESADAAADQVTIAQQNLSSATVVAPISGTVLSVSATPGASDAPGAAAFVVAGLDSWQAVTQIPVTDMPQVATGEPASVLPDGGSVPLSGMIVSVGLMPASGSNPVTYPVTIGLAGQPSGLHDGGFAGVTITTARSSGVSVPTSALHYSGSRATVTVYAAGQTRQVKVTVGTKGPVMTRITSGLRPGEQVVLANLSAPLPNNNPDNSGGGFFPGPGVHINFVGPGGGPHAFVQKGAPG
jgi:multidrug efflux pump subunit AcrA (membrane-fusion protein)